MTPEQKKVMKQFKKNYFNFDIPGVKKKKNRLLFEEYMDMNKADQIICVKTGAVDEQRRLLEVQANLSKQQIRVANKLSVYNLAISDWN